MQWYVTLQGETIGPHDGQVLFAKLQELSESGRSMAGAHVRDDSGGQWMPIEQSPFATAVVPPARQHQRAASAQVSLRRVAIGVGVTLVTLIGGLWLIGSISAASKTRLTPVPSFEPPQAAAPRALTPIESAEKFNTLREVLPTVLPFMNDTQNGELSNGAAVLAIWWSRRPSLWAELLAMPDTRRAEIMKDPDPYRGQRLCVTGTVIEIARDKSVPLRSAIYVGGISHNGGFVRFLAVNSTAGVVENTPARLCGIVIGLQTYPNRLNSTTTAVQVVGEFDLPANGGNGLQQYDEW